MTSVAGKAPGIALVLVMAACASLPAVADLISPEEQSLTYRYFLSMAVDRVDQFCASEGINGPCLMPGSPFEGGGPGFCLREVDPKRMTIDLTCKPRHPLVIDRQVPESAEYMAAPDFCVNRDGDGDGDEVMLNFLKHSNITCDAPVPLPTDRFCRGKGLGAACQAEGLLKGKIATFAGRCAVEAETIMYYQFGYRDARREFLACLPQKGVLVHRYQPVSFIRNLLLLL